MILYNYKNHSMIFYELEQARRESLEDEEEDES